MDKTPEHNTRLAPKGGYFNVSPVARGFTTALAAGAEALDQLQQGKHVERIE